MFKNLMRTVVLWTVGILGGVLFSLLRLFRRIEIKGYKLRKLIPPKEGMIVIYNHPSLWEPCLLPFLFFPWYLILPNMIPFSTPDKANYYQKWWSWPIRLVCIFIDRKEGKMKNLNELIRAIRERRILILAPEGGRTFKGKEFKIIEKGQILLKTNVQLIDDAPKIRRFQRGITILLQRTNATILPVWVEGGEKVIPNQTSFPKGPYFLFPRLREKTKIKMGEPFKTQDILQLEDVLLKLSQG